MLINPFSLVSPPLFMAADIHAIDRQWAESHPNVPLMEKAGAAAAELAGTLASDTGEPILILVGPGNNGGDALVAARLLMTQGFRVDVASRTDPSRLPRDAALAWAAYREGGGGILPDISARQRYSLLIDGLFGVGLDRAVEGEDARWIKQANGFPCPKLALDVPSGLDSDSGQIRGTAIRADHTLTYLGLKPGLFTADGPDQAGQLHLDMLGLDPIAMVYLQGRGRGCKDAKASTTTLSMQGVALTQLESRHQLPARRKNSHKGMYGHVGIIGAAPGMVGAGLIAGRAALQQGAGLVTLGTLDERIVVDFVEPRLMFATPEMLVDARLDVLVIGPGLGQSTRAHYLLKIALATPCPLVLDADALNLLAKHPELADLAARRSHPTVFTPHPGEAARLLGVTDVEVQAGRIQAARHLSRHYHAYVALKGTGTVIAHPDDRYAINTSGGPWLAQAGSGDRLTGMVAALLAQGLEAGNALEAAVWLHGSAAVISKCGF